MDETVIAFFRTLEKELAKLPEQVRESAYRQCAIGCVKDTVLPLQLRQFHECDDSLDAQYEKYGESEYFFARVLEEGHVYEIGYPRCVCPAVLAGISYTQEHCECSRQSILYIMHELLPDKVISVCTAETILGRGECCRFIVTVE